MKSDGFLDDVQIREKILHHLKNDTYRLTKHAIEEQNNANMDLQDVLHVLKNGTHEKSKTLLDNFTWKYAIRGKTEELQEARIIIAFKDQLIIITVIELWKKKQKHSYTKA